MIQVETFKLRSGPCEVVLRPVSHFHWRVLGGNAGFREGDEVCGANLISFEKARENMGGRTRLSPRRLVLLRGSDEDKSDRDVLEFLIRRPWDPDPNRPSAA